MGWAGHCVCVCLGRVHCEYYRGGRKDNVRLHPLAKPICGILVCVEPSFLLQFDPGTWSGSELFSHSMELVCSISSLLPAQPQGPACCGRLCVSFG